MATHSGVELATAYLSLVPSLDGAGAEIRRELNGPEARAAAKRAGENIGRDVRAGIDKAQLGQSLTNVGAAAIAGGTVAAAALYKTAQAAGDLGEAVNKANVVLGTQGSKAVQRFADQAVTSAGLSKKAAVDAAAGFAVFGKSAGLQGSELSDFSIQLTQLAGDFASFSNTTTDEAIVAIGAALRGESEPIRQYGILLDDITLKNRYMALSGQEVTGVLTPQQRVLAAQAEILAQSSDAQGDFTRTSDSLANQQRKLAADFENTKAVLGEALIPTFSKLAETTSGVLGTFQSLPEPLQQTAGQFAAIGTSVALAGGAMSIAAGQALKLNEYLASGTRGATALGAAIHTGVPLAIAYGLTQTAVNLAFDWLGISEDIERSLSRLKSVKFGEGEGVNALTSAIDAVNKNNSKNIFTTLRDNATDYLDVSRAAFAEITGLGSDPRIQIGSQIFSSKDFQGALTEIEKAQGPQGLKGLRDDLAAAKKETDRGSAAWRGYAEAIRLVDERVNPSDLGSGLGRTVGELATGKRSVKEAGDANSDAAKSTEEFADALAHLDANAKLSRLSLDASAAGADAFRQSIDDSTSADNLLSSGLKVGSALRNFRKDLGLVPKEEKKVVDTTNLAAEALDKLNAAVKLTDPSLSALAITLGSAQAAASAFRQSLEDSSFLDDIGSSAISVGSAFRDFRKGIRNLPADFDRARATLGRYQDGQTDAIESVIKLGDATSDYLADLIRSGASMDTVRGEAARLREQYLAQLTALGLTTDQAGKYLEVLQLTPEQVETAIKLSGTEKARFQINAYLNLLEGRIPPEVATAVVADLEGDNLDAAAKRLADFAKTNPVQLDMTLFDPKTGEDPEQKLARLPKQFDPLTAALGGYSEEEQRALDGMLALGDATKGYLAELIGAGKVDEARATAARLREEFIAQAGALGLTEAEAANYADTLLGLDPLSIDTAITVSGEAEAMFKIQTYAQLLGDEIPPSVKTEVAAAVTEGRLEDAARILAEWRALQETYVIKPPVNPDTEPGDKTMFQWVSKWVPALSYMPLGVDTSKADKTMEGFLTKWGFGGIIQLGQQIPKTQAHPTAPPLDGMGSQAGGADGNPFTPFAKGGLVGGTGSGDVIAARLTPGEFVIDKRNTDRLGTSFLEQLNNGITPSLHADAPGFPSATAVMIDATYNEVRESPKAQDLVRAFREQTIVGRR